MVMECYIIRYVMDKTDHTLIVGKKADDLAAKQGILQTYNQTYIEEKNVDIMLFNQNMRCMRSKKWQIGSSFN